MDPLLEKLARRCSTTCSHLRARGIDAVERCEKCGVIIYDVHGSNLMDAPFEDLIAASPRYRRLPDSEPEEIVSRFRTENEIIAADVKSGRLRTQKDYITTQLSSSRSGTGSSSSHNLAEKQPIIAIPFVENIQENIIRREDLFPKLITETSLDEPIQSTSSEANVPTITFSIPTESNTINLCAPLCVNKVYMQIYVDPYGASDYIGVYIDASVTVGRLVNALREHNTAWQGYVLRWSEDYGSSSNFEQHFPDFDLPPIDDHEQLVIGLGATELCLCAEGRRAEDEE